MEIIDLESIEPSEEFKPHKLIQKDEVVSYLNGILERDELRKLVEES